MLASDSGPPIQSEGLASSPPTPALASNSGPPLQLEGLASSLPTPARLSDRKAWPRRNGARFRLWPTSPTGRPGKGEDDARFRLWSASPTENTPNLCLQLFFDREARDARSVKT